MELVYRERRAWMGAATLAALCRGFEQVATPHAGLLGVGIEHLHAEGRAWVLNRMSVRVERWPADGEMLDWTTWPSRRTAGIRAARDFELRASDGALRAAACSTWLVLDLKTRRPTRLPAHLLALTFPDGHAEADWPEGPATNGFTTLARRTVVEADLDVNRHVNNVSYVAWAEEALGGGRNRRLAIEYVGEAFLGDTVEVGRGGNQLRVMSGERLLARLLVLA
jgi:acyl-ACP thioesterase